MNALILGGQSPRHQEWVRQVAAALVPKFDDVKFLDYRSWSEPDAKFDINYETEQAVILARGMGDFVVVAKSIGTVIAALANAHGLLKPKRCVFVGFPLKVASQQVPEVANALKALPPTVFLHNENDPLGTSAAVFAFVKNHAPVCFDLKSLPGDTHDYIDFALIAELAAKP